MVSVQSFRLVMDNSIVLDTWLRMMNAHKAELHGAVLHSIAKVLDSSDEQMINFSYESAEGMLLTLPKLFFLSLIVYFQKILEGKSSLEQRPLNNTKEVVDMKKRLFHNIGKFKTATALSHLIKLARQPVDELKHGALDILRSLATQPSGWGVAELFYVNIAMNDTGS